MFAGHAEGASLVELTEQGAGTKMAVFNPEGTGLNRVQDGPAQRAFLRMAICTGTDIGDHSQGRGIDHQRFAGQGPPRGVTQFLNAMLTGCEAVAIDDVDPIALQPRGACTAHVLDERGQCVRAVAHQLRRAMRLYAIELVIDRDERGAHLVLVRLVSRAYRGLDTNDDWVHQI